MSSMPFQWVFRQFFFSQPRRRADSRARMLHSPAMERLEERVVMSATALSRVGQLVQQGNLNQNSQASQTQQAYALSPVGQQAAHGVRADTAAPSLATTSLTRLVSGRDLAATSITVRETTAEYGSLITVSGTVRNNGSTTISSYQIGFTADLLRNVRGDQIGNLVTRTRTLRPGQSDSFTISVSLEKPNGGLAIQGSRYIGMSIVREGRDPTGNNTVSTRTALRITPSTTVPDDLFDSEPNNTSGTADRISFGSGYHSRTFYGSTGSGSDTQDWLRVNLNGRTSGTITLSGMTQDLDLELYNSSGVRIARSVKSGIRTDAINLNNLADGAYFVRVVPGITGARSAYALRFGLTVN